MNRLRIGIAVLATAFASLVAASAARADGLPVLGTDVGASGVTAPSNGWRYVTMPAGAANTVVARISTTTGEVLGSRLLRGTFTIPAVAYDGSASGLSHDGTTLVLIQPRRQFPRARTRLLVLNAGNLLTTRIVNLDGDFSFDAISPAGSWLYLIQYVSPNDPTRYLVRAFNAGSGRFAVKPVVDPHEPGEKMRGNPLSRVMSDDGRWAYTLYDGAGSTPFIHALDTSTRSARCIDLDALVGTTDLSRLRLRFDAGTHEVTVVRGKSAPLRVDLRTFAVTSGARSDTSIVSALTAPNVVAPIVGFALAALGVLWLRRRRTTRPALTSR
jgi:MYXO-CTERM domain-containing protein